jgi:hypothetical protein
LLLIVNTYRAMKIARNIIMFLYLPLNAFAHTDVTPLEVKDLIDNNNKKTEKTAGNALLAGHKEKMQQ